MSAAVPVLRPTKLRRLPIVQEPRVRLCRHYIDLTERETKVLAMLAGDLDAIEIADRIGGRPDTVRATVFTLREKTGARTWTQIVDTACRTGLLIPPTATLIRPFPEEVLEAVQLLAQGFSHQQIANYQGIRSRTACTRLSTVRSRTRVRHNPAAVYLLHGVPNLLDSTRPPCPTCTREGAS